MKKLASDTGNQTLENLSELAIIVGKILMVIPDSTAKKIGISLAKAQHIGYALYVTGRIGKVANYVMKLFVQDGSGHEAQYEIPVDEMTSQKIQMALSAESKVEIVDSHGRKRVLHPIMTWPGKYKGKNFPVIFGIQPNSIAEKVGIQPGDIFIKYNGISLEDESQRNDVLRDAINLARKKGLETVVISLVREGTEYEKTIPAGVLIGIESRVMH